MKTSTITPRRPNPTRRVVSVAHAFENGQSVRLKNAMLTSGNIYLITASLPTNGASLQYRIRNSKESFERMACETDLELLSPTSSAGAGAALERLFGGQHG